MITENKIVNQEFEKYKQLYRKYQEFARRLYPSDSPSELSEDVILCMAFNDAIHYREIVMKECGFKNE